MKEQASKPLIDMTKEERSQWFRLIGTKGGLAVKKKYGREYYARIGEMGGEVLRLRGKEYFSKIGSISKKRRAKP